MGVETRLRDLAPPPRPHTNTVHYSLAQVIDEVAACLRGHVGSETAGQRHDEVVLAARPQCQVAEGSVQEAHLCRGGGRVRV